MRDDALMKKLYAAALTLGLAAVVASAAALILDKSLPYRIGFSDYPKYVWAWRLTGVSIGLALLTLISGVAARKGWFPSAFGLVSLFSLLFIGGVHSGPNPQAWCWNNLREIDGAKEQLAHQRSLTSGTVVTIASISPFMPHRIQFPRCAKGGQYIINSIGNDARCTFHGTVTEMEADWQKQLKAEPSGATNRSQPIRSETN